MSAQTKNSTLPGDREKWLRFAVIISIILLTVSTALNLLLSRRVRQLSNVLGEIQSARRLDEGENAPLLEAKDLEGKTIAVTYSEIAQPTILYVFTPECVWCARNLKNIKTLANETRGKYRLIGLSLSGEGLRNYIEKNEINFPVYTDIPTSVQAAYRLGGTPQTIIVSSDGKIIQNWAGVYTEEVASEVEGYFGIHLPGIEESLP